MRDTQFIFPSVYHAFTRSSHTIYHKQRNYPEWHQGREKFYFWGIEVDDKAINSRITSLTRQLSPYLIDHYHRRQHITLFACGFESRLDACTNTLARANLRPFNLTIHGTNSFLSCPFLEVEDTDQQLDLVRKQLATVYREERDVDYTPHITLGLYAGAFRTDTLARQLFLSQQSEPLALHVNRLTCYSYSTYDIGSMLHVEHHQTLDG